MSEPDEEGFEEIPLKKWVARPGSHISDQVVQYIGDLVDSLNADGGANAQNFWQACQKAESPLHDQFNWDLQTAAEAHWEQHARYLMGAVCKYKARKDGTQYLVRAFTTIETEAAQATPGGGTVRSLRRYVDIEVVNADDVRRNDALLGAYRRMRSLREALLALVEAMGAEDVWIDKLLADLDQAEKQLHHLRDKGEPLPDEETPGE